MSRCNYPGRRRGNSEEVAERPEAQVEVAGVEAELALELFHALLELHERLAETIDLFVGQRRVVHPPQRLPFHQLPQEFDEREHELRQPALDRSRVGVDPSRKGGTDAVELVRQRPEVARRVQEPLLAGTHVARSSPAKLYGGHGPVHARLSSGWERP